MSSGALPPIESQEPLVSAVEWVLHTLMGTVGTTIAVIALAIVGYEMLLGRISMQRGMSVVLGCFIFFGAPTIVREVMSMGQGAAEAPTSIPPVQVQIAPPMPAKMPQSYDPYAGATAPQ